MLKSQLPGSGDISTAREMSQFSERVMNNVGDFYCKHTATNSFGFGSVT